MSQQQQEQLEQAQSAVTPEQADSVASTPAVDQAVEEPEAEPQATQEQEQEQSASASGKKRKKRKWKWVDAESVSPRPSYWPLCLAFSLCVLLIGVAIGPIVMGVGIVLVVVCIMGWSLERR